MPSRRTWPGRLDVVHGLGGLDVPGRTGVDPRLPAARRAARDRSVHSAGLAGFEMIFRYRSARYEIVVENPQKVSRGVASVEVDGVALGGDFAIALADDGNTHRVRIVLG